MNKYILKLMNAMINQLFRNIMVDLKGIYVIDFPKNDMLKKRNKFIIIFRIVEEHNIYGLLFSRTFVCNGHYETVY